MTSMLLIISIVVAVGIGVGLALFHVRVWTRIAVFTSMFLLSNLWASWPYFTPDSSTWLYTYSSAILASGLASLGFHVLPAWCAFKIADWRIRLRTR